MRARNRLLRSVLAMSALVGLSGCAQTPTDLPRWPPPTAATAATSNKLEELPATLALQAVRDAITGAGPVHLTGTYQEPASDLAQRTVTFDVIGTSTRSFAAITVADLTLELHRDGDRVVAHGNEALAAAVALPALANSWVECSTADEWLRPWLSLADPRAILGPVLDPSRNGSAVSVGPVRAGDPPVVQLDVSADRRVTGTMTVAAVGPPLPYTLAVSDGTGSGAFTFTAWGVAAVPDMPDVGPVGGR